MRQYFGMSLVCFWWGRGGGGVAPDLGRVGVGQQRFWVGEVGGVSGVVGIA